MNTLSNYGNKYNIHAIRYNDLTGQHFVEVPGEKHFRRHRGWVPGFDDMEIDQDTAQRIVSIALQNDNVEWVTDGRIEFHFPVMVRLATPADELFTFDAISENVWATA